MLFKEGELSDSGRTKSEKKVVASASPVVSISKTNAYSSLNMDSTSKFGLPWWLSGNESACNAGDADLIPESGRSPREGNGYPLQYSCLGNPMERDA